jgi:hypothetical protein
MEFFSSCKTSKETYTEYACCKEGLFAKIDHITPENQTKAECTAELTLFGILFSLPFDDHIHQALMTQPNLTLDLVMEAMVCFNTGVKLHLADAESANVAHSAGCWKCDGPGHLAQDCPHSSAIKDLVAMNIAYFRTLPTSSVTSQPTPTPLTFLPRSRPDRNLIHVTQKTAPVYPSPPKAPHYPPMVTHSL